MMSVFNVRREGLPSGRGLPETCLYTEEDSGLFLYFERDISSDLAIGLRTH